MSMMSQGIVTGLEAVFRVAGEKITYIKSEGSVSEVTAVRFTSQPLSVGDTRRRAVNRNMDWDVFVSDFITKIGRVPASGDRLRDKSGMQYDVVSVPGGLCYEYPSSMRFTMRIHSVEAPKCP